MSFVNVTTAFKKNIAGRSAFWFALNVVLALSLSNGTEFDHSLLAILTTCSYYLCIRNWCKCGNRLVSIFTFFIVYAFLCNCIQSLLYTLGVPDNLLSAYWTPSFSSMCDMLRYQAICIAALNLGMVLYVSKNSNSTSMKEQQEWYRNKAISDSDADLVLSFFYFICLIGSFISLANIGRVRATMSYHDFMYEGQSGLNTLFYFNYFFMFLGLRFVFQKKHVYLTYITWLLLIVGYMALGLRTNVIPYLACFIITAPLTHPSFFRKATVPFWTVAGVAFFIILGLVSATREYTGTGLASGYGGLESSLIYTISDVGSLSQMTALTIEETEKGMPHFQTIIYFLVTVVPTRVLKIPEYLFASIGPTNWNISPGTFMSDRMGRSGMGFSFLAESFMNYGWFGCVYIFLYGLLIAFLENSAYKKIMEGNFFRITFLLLLARLVFYARADLWLCNNYVEYMIFTAILYVIFDRKKKAQTYLR